MFARKWLVVSFLLSFIVSGFILSDKKASADWSFDNTGPVVHVNIDCGINDGGTAQDTDKTCNGESAAVNITCNDAVTGCKSVTYTLNGTPTTISFTPVGGQTETVYSATRNITNGNLTITVTQGKDGAGNFSNIPSATISFATCTISASLAQNSIRETTTTTATAAVTGTVTKVVFASTNASIASVNPSNDTTPPYETTVTGGSSGTARIHATGYIGTTARCDNFSGIDNSPTITITPACTISFVNNSIAIEKGDSGAAIATTNYSVDSVSVSSSNTNVATVGAITGPTGTGPYSYSAVINGMGTGTANLTGSGVIGGNTRCTTTSPATVSVSVPHAWWQVMDMDVFSPGALTSVIPIGCRLPNCNPNFNLPGLGGYPGISTYRTNFGFGRGSVAASPFSWIANSWYTGRIYDYGWFKKQVPPEVFTDERAKITAIMMLGQYLPSNGYIYDGVIWKYYSGCCFYIMGSDVVLGNNKMVLFVDGDLYISKRINFTKGSGFFAAIVSGNIYIDPSVTQSNSATDFALEGLYLVNGSFNTGESDKKLKIRGAVVAWNGVGLQRDLVGGNDTTPAEYIEYAPDLMFTFPRELSRRGVIQKEVAP